MFGLLLRAHGSLIPLCFDFFRVSTGNGLDWEKDHLAACTRENISDSKLPSRRCCLRANTTVSSYPFGVTLCHSENALLTDVRVCSTVDKYFERECRIMAEARHPNVGQSCEGCYLPPLVADALVRAVQYIGLCLAPLPPPSNIFPDRPPVDLNARPRILIISEFLPRGNLRSYIADRSLPMPWRLRLSFLIDIARAIAYLHSRNCMHRDLKGENLLVTENERVKVCDFGFARITAQNEEERRRMSYCGTDGYMVSERSLDLCRLVARLTVIASPSQAPEVLMGDDLDLPVDVFSLGVIFVEVISRTLVDNRHFVVSSRTPLGVLRRC